jgi:hypothetical protein
VQPQKGCIASEVSLSFCLLYRGCRGSTSVCDGWLLGCERSLLESTTLSPRPLIIRLCLTTKAQLAIFHSTWAQISSSQCGEGGVTAQCRGVQCSQRTHSHTNYAEYVVHQRTFCTPLLCVLWRALAKFLHTASATVSYGYLQDTVSLDTVFLWWLIDQEPTWKLK